MAVICINLEPMNKVYLKLTSSMRITNLKQQQIRTPIVNICINVKEKKIIMQSILRPSSLGIPHVRY